jgi:hypothetical protein
MRTRGWSLVAALAVVGCTAPPIETPQTKVEQVERMLIEQKANNQVDVLFMVDNSSSMEAMQSQLHQHFGDFFKVFDQLAAIGTYADLHIGVVTSDYGAGNVTFGACEASPGGQRGILQNGPSSAIQPSDAQPPPNCQAPLRTADNANARYVEYAFGPSGPTSNLPPGQDLITTFTCMAAVGAHGCGFEHQLESVYAALNNTAENAGFLRPGALLTVVFVTNEDDASAPPDTDIYDPNQSQYGYYDTYRQTRYGIACGDPLMLAPYGPSLMLLSGCQSAPLSVGGRQYDPQRYIDLFSHIKSSPEDVILVGIDAPEDPFETLLVDWTSGHGRAPNPAYVGCSPLNPPTCLVRLQHSCQNHVEPAFFGDPAIRLNAVIRSVTHNQVTSICGDSLDAQPDYSAALAGLAKLISTKIVAGCLAAPLPNPSQPDCVVTDVATQRDGTTTGSILPQCGSGGSFPCWRIGPRPECAGLSPDGIGLTIDRNGVAPSLPTVTQVECSTLAHS